MPLLSSIGKELRPGQKGRQAGDVPRSVRPRGRNSFWLVRGDIARSLAAYCGHGVYLDVALAWVVGRWTTGPVTLRSDRGRPSGYTFRRLLAHFGRLLLTAGTRPLRLISVLGVLSVLFGGALSAVIVWARLRHQIPVQGYTSRLAPAPTRRRPAVTGPLIWVIGRGGFLGSHLERLARLEIAGATGWVPAGARFSWTEPDRVAREVADAARAFSDEARQQGRPWMAVWSATAGGVGTSREVLQHETDALRGFLGSLGAGLGRGGAPVPGTLLFCSSAGGVYGQALELPLTERSPCHPISAYGETKLGQKAEVLHWAQETPGVSSSSRGCRISTGPGRASRAPRV